MATAGDTLPEELPEDSSFARGLRLLLIVADRGEIRADDLASLLDMPISTVYRYLRTLGEFGLVDHHDGRYRLGSRLVIVRGSKVSSERLIRVSEPVLHLLADQTGETALVTRRVGLSAVCLCQVESKQGVRVALEPGAMQPLYAGASSKVLLAFAPPEVIEEVIAQGLEPLTPNTASEAELRDELDEIRSAGLATSEGELIEGAVSVAAPILRVDGIVGALAVTGPKARCGPRWRARAGRLLPAAAETLAAELDEDTR